jgi:hypothetical protein
MRLPILALLLVSCLLGCTSPPDERAASATLLAAATPGALRPYPDTGKFLQCVPFARAVSGIDLYGDAWTWWGAAARRHLARGAQPQVGAVLVLRKSAQLPDGHVAVVAQLQDARHLLVTHANWGYEGDTRGVIHERMPVIDVSAANDWSEIRLMNRHGQFGRIYPAYGFISPPAAAPRIANR